MDLSVINIAIVVVYLLAMLAFGWWGKSRTRNNSDFLVAGRRLGPFLYTGTMAAVVLGGTPDSGGVALVAAVAKGVGLDASSLIADAARTVGGGGGRGADVAIAGGRDPSRLDEALELARRAGGAGE